MLASSSRADFNTLFSELLSRSERCTVLSRKARSGALRLPEKESGRSPSLEVSSPSLKLRSWALCKEWEKPMCADVPSTPAIVTCGQLHNLCQFTMMMTTMSLFPSSFMPHFFEPFIIFHSSSCLHPTPLVTAVWPYHRKPFLCSFTPDSHVTAPLRSGQFCLTFPPKKRKIWVRWENASRYSVEAVAWHKQGPTIWVHKGADFVLYSWPSYGVADSCQGPPSRVMSRRTK